MKNFLSLLFLLPLALTAQTDSTSRWLGTHYTVTAEGIATEGRHSPFWFSSNRHGLNTIEPHQHLLRLAVQRDEQMDSTRTWRLGYGADVVAGTHQFSAVRFQQLYASMRYGRSRFTLGMKEEPAYWVNPTLATGSQALGINARPIPALRWDLEWTNIGGRSKWAAIRGHISYGIVTDGAWQKDYVADEQNYIQGAVLHHKAGYLRLGNPERHAFHFTAGLEMAREFAGTVYVGVPKGSGKKRGTMQMDKDFIQYIYALVGTGGNDVYEPQYVNNGGNTVGSWRFALDYRHKKSGWAAKFYYDHFFDDHSALFEEYGWYDGLLGVEVQFPRNPIASTLLLEHVRTDYQSGPIYHDHTPALPDQISARDNYYNHDFWQGWQHYGMSRGNVLWASPMYEDQGRLSFSGTRFRAYHVGLTGQPLRGLSYRLLYTHLWSWGRYGMPYPEIKHQYSALAEVGYSWRSWTGKVALGLDRGDKIGQQTGLQITIAKTGILF